MLINPALLPVAKVAALPLLTALIVGSCTASHFRVKINNMELEWQAQVVKAENERLAAIAKQNEITIEVQNVIEESKSLIAASYANGAAAERLRIKAESTRAVRTVSNTAKIPDGAAPSDGLPERSGEASPVAFAQAAQEPYYLSMPAAETAGLLEQCDINTNKLVNLQLWVGEQLKAGEKR